MNKIIKQKLYLKKRISWAAYWSYRSDQSRASLVYLGFSLLQPCSWWLLEVLWNTTWEPLRGQDFLFSQFLEPMDYMYTFTWTHLLGGRESLGGKKKLLMCQELAREIPPMTRSCRTRGNPWAIRPMTRSCGRVLMSKASGLDGPPGPARASTPEPESVCLTILCLSPALLRLAGGCPWPKELT